MKRYRLARRTVLRGLGMSAVSVALPPLDAMFNDQGLCYANDDTPPQAPPRRLVVYWWGHGAPMGDFTPATVGTGWTPSAILAGLNEIQSVVNGRAVDQSYNPISDLSVLTGISNHETLPSDTDGNRVFSHPNCTICALCGGITKNVEGKRVPVDSSVDVLAGQLIGGYPGQQSSALSLAVRSRGGAGEGRHSWNGPTAIPPSCQPPSCI